jgi:hypothetical protein
MIRFFKAFAWLRWRLLINGLKGGRRRDSVERFSRIAALAVPAMIIFFCLVGALLLAIFGFLGGWLAGRGSTNPGGPLLAARVILLGVLAILILVPISSANTGAATSYRRLLLLPISRRSLHLAEVSASLADPWVLFVLPGLFTLAAGFLVAGRFGTALVGIAAATVMVAMLALVGSLVSFLISWLMRNRRRGELFTLVFVLVLSGAGIVPALFADKLGQKKRGEADRLRAEPSQTTEVKPREELVDRLDSSLSWWTLTLPSELYGRSIARAARGEHGLAWLGLSGLVLESLALYGVSFAVHRKLLESTETAGRRRRRAVASLTRRLPGLSMAASAVAFAQARTALRSVRGRLIVFMPGPLIALLNLLAKRIPEAVPGGSFIGSHGFVALGTSLIFAMYALQALTMNQFASDRAGFTLQVLSPVSDEDLVKGKAAGCAMIFLVTAALCLISIFAVTGSGPLLLWISVLLAGAATYSLMSPAAAVMSAYFPVASDLSKTGTGGNPHGLAMFVGTLLVFVLGLPPGLIIAICFRVFESPGLTVTLMTIWTLMACLISVPLLKYGARALASRKENLVLVAQGR